MKDRIVTLIVVICSVFIYNINVKESIVFIDVGQGDSSIIFTNYELIVIDGGEFDYLNTKLSKYIQLGKRKIDHLIITHPHSDHYLGINHLLKYYQVENLYIPNICVDDIEYIDLIKKMERSGVNIYKARMMYIDTKGDTNTISVIEKAKECKDEDANVNNQSVIVFLQNEADKYLFMGDAEKEREVEFLEKYGNKIRDIAYLKAGHHCSDTSSGIAFITILNPKNVVCSYGEDNKYGHPSIGVIDSFKGLNSKIFHTIYGDIVVKLE